MEFLQQALRNLPQAAKTPYALLAYLIVIIAWVVIALQVSPLQSALDQIQNVPEQQRAEHVEKLLQKTLPKEISADQWLKSRRDSYLFYGYLALLAVVVFVFVIAVGQKKTAATETRKIVEEVLKQQSESISVDVRLQQVAREQGKPLEQLKAEIDAWITQVKTPYERGLAAFYQEKYGEAKDYLEESIESSKQELALKYFYLGNANREIALRTQGNAIKHHFEQAINAYRNALQVHTREELPQQWATTQNNLANALRNLRQLRAVQNS